MRARGSSFGEHLHICVLVSVAVAQPVFDLISRNADWLTERRWERADIAAVVALLCLLVPGVLVAANSAAGLLGSRFQRLTSRSIVAALIAAVAAQALARLGTGPWVALAGVALLLGGAFAAAYGRFVVVRSFVTFLSPALLLFPALFLFHPAVSKIAFPRQPSAVLAPPILSKTPVVLVVFDELPIASLMNGDREIDAVHYPNFAALGRGSTWFRDVTTPSHRTVQSIAAILTGRYVAPSLQPIAADHPENLCAWLAGSYRLETAEAVSRLCGGERARAQHASTRFRTLMRDVAFVYLQTLLPEELARRLVVFRHPDDPAGEFAQFLDRVQPGESPGFYFIHTLLPHQPYWRLPSGQIYVKSPIEPSGQGNQWGAWESEEWPVIQSYQRHLLQLGFADTLLGRLLARVKEAGLYEEAAIIVTADHGVSFRPGDSRREISGTNLADLLSVPLFVKVPHQQQGRVSDVKGSTVDIVPMVADVLGVPLPWAADGRSLLNGDAGAEPHARWFYAEELRPVDETAVEARYESLARKLEWFDGWFKVGPARELVGSRVATLKVQDAPHLDVQLFESRVFESVNPESYFVPSQIVGSLRVAETPPDAARRLAIAINGLICATTRTYESPTPDHGGLWSAVVDPKCFVPGRNRVEVFLIESAEEGPILLRPAGSP